MPANGQTGLVVPVPAADALLASVEARYPGTVRVGLPAHVSLLYPFLAAAELDERVITALGELFRKQAPMPVTFTTCYRRGGFVALRPDPLDGPAGLIDETRRRWPHLVPYGGRYGAAEPHLTVAMSSSTEVAAVIEQEVPAALPIPAQLREVLLVVFEERWTLRDRFDFGSR
ncbi:MAG: 2'-5' RNA ligase family protein [Pseudonocardiaceae bacterium]